MTKLALIAVVAGALLAPLHAQTASGRTLTLSQATREDWNDIGRKLITMAEDFPEDKYDYKPTPAQRTFAEQLLHVAGSNDLFTAVAKGQKPVDDEDRSHFKTKADVVAYLKKSFAEGAAEIQAQGDSGMVRPAVTPESHTTVPLVALAYGLAEHAGEHYGQLVGYYRSAGMVPPES